METINVKLSQVKVNADNPRTIKKEKFDLLVERLLVFPKMIALRPVVVDNTMTALGGNMRIKAFQHIATMTLDDIKKVASKTKDYKRLTKAEQESWAARWGEWLKNPTVPIVKAENLSAEEKKQFIIADNASFGEWDYDLLGNAWDSTDLLSWGLDVWNSPDDNGTFGSFDGSDNPVPSYGSTPSSGGTGQPANDTNLPPELQGQDINPDELPKINGDNETAMERVIIVYPKERADEVAQLLGLERVEKVVYQISEIINE